MMMHWLSSGVVAAIAGALCLSPANAESRIVRADGSSTVFPITEAVAEEFQNLQRGQIRVTVGISGTGGGFKKFIRGEIDVANASRPILESEMLAAREAGIEYIELPVAFDAITVIVNKDNDWLDSITVEELKRIWQPDAQETILRWNQIRPEWPDAPLALFGPGADSGTFDYFTEAVVGKSKSSRGDFTASEDDNVLVQGVANDKNALGYLGYAYFAENQDQLKAVAVGALDSAVLPDEQSVIGGSYQPLSRPIFIYVNKQSLAEKPEVRQFVEFYIENAAELARAVKYIPLPPEAYAKAAERVKSMSSGTAYGGAATVGIHIDELFERELRQ